VKVMLTLDNQQHACSDWENTSTKTRENHPVTHVMTANPTSPVFGKKAIDG
jgi:hypothetical protein